VRPSGQLATALYRAKCGTLSAHNTRSITENGVVPAVPVPVPVSDGGLGRFEIAAHQLPDDPGGVDYATGVLSARRCPINTPACQRPGGRETSGRFLQDKRAICVRGG